MQQIWFYHLQQRDMQESLPDLLVKILTSGKKAVILGRHQGILDALDNSLWQNEPHRWLPHAQASHAPVQDNDTHDANQPLFLTIEEQNPAKADMLITIDGADIDFTGAFAQQFTRIFDMFDGNDPMAVEAARNRWRQAKSSGADLAYWQQTMSGGWQRKQ